MKLNFWLQFLLLLLVESDAKPRHLHRKYEAYEPKFEDYPPEDNPKDDMLRYIEKIQRKVPMNKSKEEKTQIKWMHKTLTWRLFNISDKLERAATENVLQEVLSRWSQAADLLFVHDTQSETSDIMFSFGKKEHGDGYPFKGKGNIMAHAFAPPTSLSDRVGGSVHFDDEEDWTIRHSNDPDKTQLFPAALHEVGHSLGLTHSPDKSAIMFPYYMVSSKSAALGADDIKKIQALYGPSKQRMYTPGDPLPYANRSYNYMIKKPQSGMCNVTIDAVLNARTWDFIVFSGESVWRHQLRSNQEGGYNTSGSTYKLHDLLRAIPSVIKRVDAAFERHDGMYYIFSGNRFWILRDFKQLMSNFPREGLDLTYLDLPGYNKKVDTLFRFAVDKKVYLVSGTRVWEFDDRFSPFGKVIANSINHIGDKWPGVPTPFDEAVTLINGKSIFIKGKSYCQFDGTTMRVNSKCASTQDLSILDCQTES